MPINHSDERQGRRTSKTSSAWCTSRISCLYLRSADRAPATWPTAH